jgi:hypothetical protein
MEWDWQRWRDAKARKAWVEKEGREKGREAGIDLVLQLAEKGYTPQQIKEAIAAQQESAEP